MSANGTRPAILIHELFSGDGPYGHVAEHFLASVCSHCGGGVEREGAHFRDDAYLCQPCGARGFGQATQAVRPSGTVTVVPAT